MLERWLSIKVETKTRTIIDRLAEERKITMGAATRELIEAGIQAKGLAENE